MIKKYYIALFISIFVNSIAILSGAINWYFQFGVTAVVFFISGLFSSKFQIKGYKYFLIICSPFFIYTFFTIYNYLTHVFPIAFIPYLSLFIGIYISNHSGRIKLKIIYSISYFLFILCFIIFIMPNYLSYIFNNDYNNVKNQSIDFHQIDFYDSLLNKVEIYKMKGKVVVLDFWTTSCAECYRKFPEFEKLSERYKSNDNIKFYAVNINTKGDSIDDLINHVRKLGYKFQFLFTKSSDAKSIQSKISIYSFPTLIIINQHGKIALHGQLITSDIIFYNNAKKTIEKLLNYN
jgi:thiol-disulfide isomerase/thioredoxin